MAGERSGFALAAPWGWRCRRGWLPGAAGAATAVGRARTGKFLELLKMGSFIKIIIIIFKKAKLPGTGLPWRRGPRRMLAWGEAHRGEPALPAPLRAGWRGCALPRETRVVALALRGLPAAVRSGLQAEGYLPAAGTAWSGRYGTGRGEGCSGRGGAGGGQRLTSLRIAAEKMALRCLSWWGVWFWGLFCKLKAPQTSASITFLLLCTSRKSTINF